MRKYPLPPIVVVLSRDDEGKYSTTSALMFFGLLPPADSESLQQFLIGEVRPLIKEFKGYQFEWCWYTDYLRWWDTNYGPLSREKKGKQEAAEKLLKEAPISNANVPNKHKIIGTKWQMGPFCFEVVDVHHEDLDHPYKLESSRGGLWVSAFELLQNFTRVNTINDGCSDE